MSRCFHLQLVHAGYSQVYGENKGVRKFIDGRYKVPERIVQARFASAVDFGDPQQEVAGVGTSQKVGCWGSNIVRVVTDTLRVCC